MTLIHRRTIEEKRENPRNSKPIAFRTYPNLRKRFIEVMRRYKDSAEAGVIPSTIVPEPGQALTDFLQGKVEEWEVELEAFLKNKQKEKELVVK